MQTVSFSKFSGCGNDFILIDHRSPFLPAPDTGWIQPLCHRQKGVGADGVILLESSRTCDFKMRIYNCDGSEAEMCGNGLRCLAKFIYELGFPKKPYTIETMHRQLTVEPYESQIKTSMGAPEKLQLNLQLQLGKELIRLHSLDTGVPHAVMFVDDLEKIPVEELGSQIHSHAYFSPACTNANFVKKLSSNALAIRTYERGVEAETLACGTGATAAAIIAALTQNLIPPISVQTRSGDTLMIDFKVADSNSITQVTQTGPALKSFQGVFELKPTLPPSFSRDKAQDGAHLDESNIDSSLAFSLQEVGGKVGLKGKL